MKSGFSHDDELTFRNSKQYIQEKYIRLVFALFIFLFALFGFTDTVYFPDSWQSLFIVRFGIVIPVFITVIILTFTKTFLKNHQIIITLSAFAGGLSIAYMLILKPDNIAYYGGMFMIYFSIYFIIKLRFNFATFAGWTIFGIHIIGFILIGNTISATFIYSTFFFAGSNLIGMVGNYHAELMDREHFLYEKEIKKVNIELIDQYEEKAFQLEQLEKSILENKQLHQINLEKSKLTESLQKSEEKYKQLVNQMQLGLALHEIVLDEEGNPINYIFLVINDSYTKLFGITREMCIGKCITEVMPLVEPYWIETFGKVAITGESIYYENYLETTGKYYSTYTYSPSKGEFAVLVTDITERKQLEDALNESNEKYMAIFKKSPISIEYYDADGNLAYVNEASLDLFGVQNLDELRGYNLLNNPNLSPDLITKISNFEHIHVEMEYSFDKVKASNHYKTNKTGTMILNLSITPLLKENHINGYIVHTEDITLERQKQKEVEYLSYHDFLTNLYNRRYFVSAFNKYMREEQYPLGVMMVDINGLKIINDAYGHRHGDLTIKLVADLFMDVFDQNNVVARIGGDEFAILVPNKSSEELQAYKELIIEHAKKINVGNIEISLAIGYEMIYDNIKGIDEVLSDAENYLYRHKVTVGASIRNHAIKAILNTLTDKYIEEKVHSERVSNFCREIGVALEMSKEDIDVLELAGMYHDIGKISIPDAILNKPSKLTTEEFEIIKSHTLIGYQILKAADEYSGLAEYALSHHERWDGKGYPKGLKGIEIPLFSRIINVADSFEAMTANRPYREGLSIEQAKEEIRRCSGSQFDPTIAQIFIDEVLCKIEIQCDEQKSVLTESLS